MNKFFIDSESVRTISILQIWKLELTVRDEIVTEEFKYVLHPDFADKIPNFRGDYGL